MIQYRFIEESVCENYRPNCDRLVYLTLSLIL